jgi:uncharacterized membrane protein
VIIRCCLLTALSDILLSLFAGDVTNFVISYYFLFFANSLDPEQKDMLIEVIEKLLADKTTVSMSIIECILVLTQSSL